MKIQEIIVILLVGKKISFLVLRNETIILLYFSQPKRLFNIKKERKNLFQLRERISCSFEERQQHEQQQQEYFYSRFNFS